MTRECYRTPAGTINRSPTRLAWALGALGAWAFLAAGVVAQEPAPAGAEPTILATAATFLRAHPSAAGPITLVRHEHAYARTTTERGTLQLTAGGARLTLDDAEVAITPGQIEAFDGAATPPRVIVQRGETVLARYAALLAGDDPALLFSERVIARDARLASVELLPRAAWLGLERVVLRVVLEGADTGRIERALWLDGLGNWQRLDLERLRHPTLIDPRSLLLSPHPGARRVEI